jgi:ribosomal protein S18 acetylase RimI-like enzyme
MTAPNDDFSSQSLSEEGFTSMTQLVYLVDELTQEFVPHKGGSLSWSAFEPEAEPRLARLLERTYVGTLDCPWLDRLRTTADVLAGYRAVGKFDPSLWKIARNRGEDVGCVLVNVHPDVWHAEVVYLGLVPEVRGRGWGRELVECARRLALQAGCRRMVLAVDDANEPAKRLYAKCGMVEFARRVLWLHR